MVNGMAVRCIALDLDGTTLNREGRLSEGNQKALEAVIAAGIHVVIASGRAFSALPNDILRISGIAYAVTCNGAAMYHVPTRKCLKRHRLSADAVEAVMEATRQEGVPYEAFIDGVAYAGREYVENPERFGASSQAVAYIQTTRHKQDDIVGFIHENKQRLDGMDMIVRNERQKDRVWELVRNASNEVYITSSAMQLVEIASRNAGKKAGVAYFVDLLGLGREEVAAFGDADNDIDMLRYAGCGIAVGNASLACKEAADYVTKHHDEDGLAYGLKTILQLLP